MNATAVRRIGPGHGAAAMPPGNASEVDAEGVLPFHTGTRAVSAPRRPGRRVPAQPGRSAPFARG